MIADEGSFGFCGLLLIFFFPFSGVIMRSGVCFFSSLCLLTTFFLIFLSFLLGRLRAVLYEVSVFMTFPAFE